MATTEDIAHQQKLLATYRRTLEHLLQQRGQFTSAYAPPVVLNGIDEARSQITRIKNTLRGWGIDTPDHPNDSDEPLPAQPVSQPVQATATVDRVKIRNALTQAFSDNELRDLCFELSLDYDDLPGETRSSKARELVTYLERRGKLQTLTEYIRNTRPEINLL